ncbi:MAG: zinc ribbon domain-containing protein [Clostridia bacterium]|nr:zinc ribbon domain-containing protein [Clostridia bacterium]
MAHIFCAHCGKANEDTSKFCAHCGAAMENKQPNQASGFGDLGEIFADVFGASPNVQQNGTPKQVHQQTPFGTIRHTVYEQPKTPQVELTPELAAKVKKFKRKHQGGKKFRMICVPVAIVSALLTRFVGMPFGMTWLFAPVYIISVFPGVVGVFDLIGMLVGNKPANSVKRLEERGMLPLLVQEMEQGNKVPFGDSAWMSDHFIFGKKGKGVIVAIDDVLLVYTTYLKHHYTLKVGTKTLGTTQIFGTGVAARFNKGYKEQLQQAFADLKKRNPNVLLGGTSENFAKYESLREK